MHSVAHSRPSRAVARRAAAITVAIAVLASPLLVAGPAMAEDEVPVFPITSVSFGQSVLNIGGDVDAYFNDNVSTTSIAGDFICMSEYKNGVSYTTNSVAAASAFANFTTLTGSEGFVEDDEYAVAFYPLAEPELQCAAPELGAAGTFSASITIGALPVPIEECADCTVTAAPVALKQGVAVDLIVPLQWSGDWGWTDTAYAEAGPMSGSAGTVNPFDGLAFESIAAPGVAPQLRIHGTPRYSGTFDAVLQVGNGYDAYAIAPLMLVIAPASGTSPIVLDLTIGQPVAGATANIVMSGLKPGADFSVTVRSTPIMVGAGTIAIDGVFARSFTIPAGLEAGRHSITLSSTLANGTAVNSVLWFTVSATGTLLSVSITAPQLPSTGAEAAPVAVLMGSLLLIGAAFAGASVYRRRKVAA